MISSPPRSHGVKRTFEYNGELKTVAEWSKATGIKVGTINSRLYKGWSIREIIQTAPNKALSRNVSEKISKNDGEMFLNDLDRSSLHCSLFQLTKHYGGKQYGQYLRANHREAFDKWYDTVFYPEQIRIQQAMGLERSKIQQTPI